MVSFTHLSLPFSNAGFMTWDGDTLIAWENLAIYGLDGSKEGLGVRYGYRFDKALRSDDGRNVIIYEKFGTKGVIIADGKFLREINRSYYCADLYEFPLEMFSLPDGRTALAHCPNGYNQIEIELVSTGERLTRRDASRSTSEDMFHAGLAVDPSGLWLMSAGWIWQPCYEVRFFSVAEALETPSSLDRGGLGVDATAEIGSAAFLAADLAVLASDPDSEPFDIEAGHEGMIGLYRPSERRWESRVRFDAAVGKMLPVDESHVLSLYKHPKLIHVPSGLIVDSWPEIDSGSWRGCISSSEAVPPMSWDPVSKRLAVAGHSEIHILALVT